MCLLPYLSTFSRIGPFHFPAGCCRRRLNLALPFVCVEFVLNEFFSYRKQKAAKVEINISLAFLYWIGIALHL